MIAFCLFQTISKTYNSNTFKQRKRTPNMQQVTYLFIRNAEQDGLRDFSSCDWLLFLNVAAGSVPEMVEETHYAQRYPRI